MSTIKHFFTKKNSPRELGVDTAFPLSNCPPTASIPRIVVPVGDPAGIGMEVVLKAMAKVSPDYAVTLVGTRIFLEQTYHQLSKLSQSAKGQLADPANLDIINVDLDAVTQREITLGVGNAASGAASFAYLQRAIASTIAGDFQAIATAPIAKAAWQLAGHDYPGQTEVLAAAAGVDRYGMLFVGRSPHTGWQLRTLLATTHISLAQVPTALTPALMSQKLELLLECLQQDFGISHPRIAIAGLNPHSGEAGQMGTEELDWLNPWLQTQRVKYPHATLDGLFPPDTLWVKPGMAWYGQGYETSENSPIKAHDTYLALYHDQGLIPVKLMAFDRAINTTIGLPFVRTSPDHGTAFDIAGRGIANSRSMTAALDLAGELVKTRTS